MSAPFDKDSSPRIALLALAGLVVFSVISVGVARLQGVKVGVATPMAVIEHRDLRFLDAGSGLVEVRDADSGIVLATMHPGTENFVRGVLRSMARERRSHAFGTQIPFRIARHVDGHLTLQDLSTGRRIDLQAFGPTNAGAFERLLDASAQGS